ncbi:MAG: RNA-binding protein [Paenibacillus sp. RIFOXYA1_FULL_44_5]|nr:MAG: RNA-binding protein [Paenibacillus sp. RIFOXYA1_FULL_44_5]
MKTLLIQTDYITLGQLLKIADIISTGGQVKFFLQETEVFINNEIDQRRGRKVYPGDIVEVKGYGRYIISRK